MFKSLQWKRWRHTDIKPSCIKYYKFIFITFWSSNIFCSHSVRTTLSPVLINHTMDDGWLGNGMRSKICSWYNFLLHCIYNCITGFCYAFLSQIYQIIYFLVDNLHLYVSSHHKFSLFKRFNQTLQTLSPKPAKCDKRFLLVFPNSNTHFHFLTDSLKHPAKWDQSFSSAFPNAICIC